MKGMRSGLSVAASGIIESPPSSMASLSYSRGDSEAGVRADRSTGAVTMALAPQRNVVQGGLR